MAGSRRAEPQSRRRGRESRPRRHRIAFRRARSLAGALGVTLLGAVVPGAGYVWTRRRLGYVVLLPSLVVAALLVVYARDFRHLIDVAFDPLRLRVAAVLLAIGFLVWAFTVVTTYLMARPPRIRRGQSRVGLGLVCAVCLAVALPVAVGARYAMTQADLVASVFERQRERHRSGRRQRRGPVGRPGPGQRPAPRRRRWRRSHRHQDGHGDPAQHEHRDRQVGDVQPAAQHDERAVPRGQPAARRVPGRLHRRGRSRLLDAQRRLRAGARDVPGHPRQVRQRGR